MNFKNFSKLIFPKHVISIFKICKNVLITHERDSKLLTMYHFDYSYHRDVNYCVSEYLDVDLKSAQNLKIYTFVPNQNALYPHCRLFEKIIFRLGK